jgi:signal transduction histidine kinase
MHRALHPAAVGERVELSLQPVPDETLWVWADRRRLRQVINNLVQNAIRHSPTGGTIELSVSVVSGGADGQQVCILVRDEGPGIPVEERERIFERLVRLDPSRNRQSGGQGLGLSIVLQIVEAHGGKVGVTDAPGGGAQFWVRLPMSAAPEEG